MHYFVIADHRAEAASYFPTQGCAAIFGNCDNHITIEQKIPYLSPLHDKVCGENCSQE
jgi:hypothetical protein